MKKTTERDTPGDPVSQMTALMAEWQKLGLGSLSWMGSGWIERMNDMGAEWLSFVAERVQEDVRFQHQILHARSPEQVQHLQAEFLQKALDDYAAETGRILQRGSKLFDAPPD